MSPDETSPDVARATEMEVVGRRGARALAGVAIAIVGVLAAANPNSAVLRALNQAMPHLADALPALITAVGALVAAFSPPPKVRRRRARHGGKGQVAQRGAAEVRQV